jgi:hypothetical protein
MSLPDTTPSDMAERQMVISPITGVLWEKKNCCPFREEGDFEQIVPFYLSGREKYFYRNFGNCCPCNTARNSSRSMIHSEID